MLRLVFSAVFGLLFTFSYGQLKKFYTLKEENLYDTVRFSLEATAGNCFIKAADNQGPLVIFGNPDLEKINPSFKTNIKNRTCSVALDLEEYKATSLGDGLLMAMLRDSDGENNFWKILFDHQKVYKFYLNYGFGNADVDLSGTAVENLKIKSGSADILVDYHDGRPNRIEMDSFLVKADMGSIIAKHLELARARYVRATIGFGRALLDLSAAANKCTVDASVGAGSLDIFLPDASVPMIIYVKDSPLCGMNIAEGFEEVESNVYVNMNYRADAANLITFRVDVAMGNISFHGLDN